MSAESTVPLCRARTGEAEREAACRFLCAADAFIERFD